MKLAEYQHLFCTYLRSQNGTARPKGTNARGIKTYQRLVFNNMEALIAPCFPVCQQVLKKRKWKKLMYAFLASAQPKTPYFQQIPVEFMNWLEKAKPVDLHGLELPEWFCELAHWEWIELAVSIHQTPLFEKSAPEQSAAQSIFDQPIVFNPSMQLAAYSWPVHKIGPRRKIMPKAVWLLAYRDEQGEVHFVELTAGSYALLLRLQEGEPIRTAVSQLAAQWQRPAAPLLEFSRQLVEQMQVLGVLRLQ